MFFLVQYWITEKNPTSIVFNNQKYNKNDTWSIHFFILFFEILIFALYRNSSNPQSFLVTLQMANRRSTFPSMLGLLDSFIVHLSLPCHTILATHHVGSPCSPPPSFGLNSLQWPGRSLSPLVGSLSAMWR